VSRRWNRSVPRLSSAVAVTVSLATIVALGALPTATAGARGGSTPCAVPGYGVRLNFLWKPDMRAAIDYARTRHGDIAFAVRTDHRFYGYRPEHVEWSASVVKAMLLVAYLDRPSVANRPLNGYDGSLLRPMIEFSDNNAASTVVGIVGDSGLWALAHRVGMKHFGTDPVWGKTRITADDQTKFLYSIDRYVVPRHRAFAMHLLASVTPSQRWGIGEIPPAHWSLYFKGGWGYGTGLLDHQVVLLTRGCARTSLAVLTMFDGSHQYGKDTLRGIFSRLLRGFPTAKAVTWKVASRGGDAPAIH
jgi:hypothetical protein